MKYTHKEVVEDYRHLVLKYDQPFDLTGGMVVEEFLMEAVERGTKSACRKCIEEIIKYGFQWDRETYRYQCGGDYAEVGIDDCDYIRYIFEKYIE